MKRTYEGVTIKEGDVITIAAQGVKVKGTVLSVDHNGPRDGWYIELGDATSGGLIWGGGYCYWKQGSDGGRVVEVNGKEIPNTKGEQ